VTTYRAWCLSWGEEEEHGADVVPYDILNHDTEGQRQDTVYVPDTLFRGAEDAAEAYAEYVHDHREGYDATWPLTFRVCAPDGKLSDFEIWRDYVPEFTVRRLASPDETNDETNEEAGEAHGESVDDETDDAADEPNDESNDEAGEADETPGEGADA
jgi:hypothetical protein